MQAMFQYRKEGNEYVIYENDMPLLTLMGNKVCTTNEDLAAELVKALKKEEEIDDAKSILCFHFTFLDSQEDKEEIMQEAVDMPLNELMNDPYLMFRQSSPIRQVIAQYFSDALPAHISNLPFHKKLAFMTMATSCQTYMLPYYIDHDIIGKEDAEACKEAFYEDMSDYLYELIGSKQKVKSYLKEVTPVINTYIKYMSYDEV